MLDVVKNLVRIARIQTDSLTCKKRKSQNDNKKVIFEMASNKNNNGWLIAVEAELFRLKNR